MADTLALFDLDNTLLPLDSDYEWGEFVVRIGAVDKDYYEGRNAEFFRQYKEGTLNPGEYLLFVFGELAKHPRKQLDIWHNQFMDEVIRPAIKPSALALVEKHRQAGHLCAIVTATCRFITEPISREFGITNLIAADAEMRPDGSFTGRLGGIPTSGQGKITHVNNWLDSIGSPLSSFKKSYFYSDSATDLPLLSVVSHPVATNPSEGLRTHAQASGWPVLELFK